MKITGWSKAERGVRIPYLVLELVFFLNDNEQDMLGGMRPEESLSKKEGYDLVHYASVV